MIEEASLSQLTFALEERQWPQEARGCLKTHVPVCSLQEPLTGPMAPEVAARAFLLLSFSAFLLKAVGFYKQQEKENIYYHTLSTSVEG